MRFKPNKTHQHSRNPGLKRRGWWPRAGLWMAIGLCLVLLGGCGQKGDLVLPDPPPAEKGG